MGSCNPRLAAATNRIMARHYPERLGYALMINAPWIFNATWVAMKTFVDAKTVAKIQFVKVRRVFVWQGDVLVWLVRILWPLFHNVMVYLVL